MYEGVSVEVIDENGDLFGRVNVIDALVVLVVLAVAVAGAALVFGGDEPEPTTATVNATLDLGTQPAYVVEAIQEGDTHSPTSRSTLRVTDVYTTPAGDDTRVVVAVQLTGETAGDSIAYDGGPPRLGRTLGIVTSAYQVDGQVRALGGNGTLRRTQTTVTVRDRLSADEAAALHPGDTVRVAGRTAATIRNVTVQPTGDPAERLAFLTVDLQTLVRDGVPRFAGSSVREGRGLRLSTAAFTVDGTVERVGGGPTTVDRRVVVRQVVDDATVGQTAPGSEITIDGDTVVRVADRVLQPTDDPTRHVAYLTVNVTGVERAGDARFGGRTLQRDGRFQAAGDDIRLDGEIERLDEPLGTVDRAVVLRTRLPAERARRIAPGDDVAIDGQTLATVENASVYTTDDPDERVAFLAVDLTAVERGGDEQFAGTPVRRGQTLSLDTGEYTVDGRIDRVGGGLDRTETAVLIRDTVDTDTAERLSAGDRVRVAGRSTATVENVSVFGTADPDRKRVAVGLSLRTVGYGERPQFGGNFVAENNDVALRTDDYRLSGSIDRVGTTTRRGTATTRPVTLRLDEVRDDLARSIRAGMTERSGDRVLATVTDVSREPSTVLIRGERGDLGVFDHPTLRAVTITADLQVRQTGDGVRFKGEPLQQGETVVLDLGTVTVEVTVVSVGR